MNVSEMFVMVGPGHRVRKGLIHTLRARLTERNTIMLLTVMFIVLTIWIVTVPYDPAIDKADATANLIWKEYYREGRYAVPYDEFQEAGHPRSQSSVVELDGEPYVVNEKGPGHAMLCMVLGPATGTFFAAMMAISTYMLGRRIFNWRVGAIASVIMMTNLVVMVMWHRYLWVDASTMPLCVLSMWLFVESGLRLKRYVEGQGKDRGKALALAFLLGLGGGITFGAAVSTRYTVGILVIAPVIYVLALFGGSIVTSLRRKDIRRAAKNLGRAVFMVLPFIIGLFIILVPLMNYNNTYFGGPFRSGYDATTLMDYEKAGDLVPRNQSDYLKGNLWTKVEIIASNTVVLFPVIVLRILAIIFVPYAVWRLRRRPILYLLLPWMLLIFIAFLTLSWVSMYANLMHVVQEPRYSIPAYPAIALMAGYAIDAICTKDGGPGGRRGSMKIREAAFIIGIVAMLILPGITQAQGHFSDLRDGFYPDRPPGPQPPPQPPTQNELVTIEQIHRDPVRLNDRLVEVRDCNVTHVERGTGGEMLWFDMTQGASPDSVIVRPVDFPPDKVPPVDVGTRVSVSGLFQFKDQDKDQRADPGELMISVKSGTKDTIKILK